MAKYYITKPVSVVQGGPIVMTQAGSGLAGQFHGEIMATSRDTLIAAPLVTAASYIRIDQRWIGPSSYGVGVNFSIGSVMPGSGFYATTINSVGFGAANTASVQLYWEIKLTS